MNNVCQILLFHYFIDSNPLIITLNQQLPRRPADDIFWNLLLFVSFYLFIYLFNNFARLLY